MRVFAWILLMIAGIPACVATATGALGAVASVDNDRLASMSSPVDDIFHRMLDPLPGQCCGMCTQLRFNPEMVILLIAFGTEIGGQLNPFILNPTTTSSSSSLYIVIVVRVVIRFFDLNAVDPTEVQTVSFDSEVLPEHWNMPCSYTDNCTVFANDEITMFAPTTVGGFGVLSLQSVSAFTDDSNVNIISSTCDLRCKTDSLCDPFEPSEEDLIFDGIGLPFGTIQQSTFNNGFCTPGIFGCGGGTSICDDPHMTGLRGQTIEVSGMDGGWYCLVQDDADDIQVNIRLTAPLPIEYPHRQLITGLAVISTGHSLTVEVKDPYSAVTGGCLDGISPCLADGGVRIAVDGHEVDSLLAESRMKPVADGIWLSASNLPVECQQFGGDKIWARTHNDHHPQTSRRLETESFEDWVLRFDNMAAPDWCAKYIAESGLTDVQSNHAVFKIETPVVSVRLNTGVNHQGDGEVDWDGSVLPELDFWQMGVGFDGLSIDHMSLSGLLGETARPVKDGYGGAVMQGDGALRGTVEDYRVSTALGTEFALLSESP